MSFPSWSAGQRITAQKLSDMEWNTATNGDNQVRNNTTTYLATNLVVPAVAGATYWYRLLVSYVAIGVAPNNYDIKFRWQTPTNGAVERWIWAPGRGTEGAQDSQTEVRVSRNTAASEIVVGGTDVNQLPLGYNEEGEISGGDGGNFTLEFAQNIAGVFDTTVQAASRIHYLRIG